MGQWKYERGEGRHKHRWQYDYAGFVPGQKGAVGKCPKSITEEIATDILNNGEPYFENDDDDMPVKIYSVYKGVVYESVPTQPGVSWHGYPWRGDLKGRLPLSRKMKNRLKIKADAEGYGDEYLKWLKDYS
ncbi:hypothetical protein [Vreelandella titanicae]|uniref:hypothetical protein n=1 Tax=Vreelandella titanicae TaxID=664683 RepID=UPI00168069C2|nr:hypothetical protein [Halomonas titanicae]QNU62092.1 hypothetical protein HZS52_20465 [Halomonas titanicae]